MEFEPKDNPLILIVEDDASIKELVKAVISHEGKWKSVSVECGTHAIEAWDQADFDLILMDLHLPIMGGIEATRKIREFEKTTGRKHTPIVAFTAIVDESCKQECINAGFDDFIAKPAKIQEILDAVHKHIQH